MRFSSRIPAAIAWKSVVECQRRVVRPIQDPGMMEASSLHNPQQPFQTLMLVLEKPPARGPVDELMHPSAARGFPG